MIKVFYGPTTDASLDHYVTVLHASPWIMNRAISPSKYGGFHLPNYLARASRG